ncbi:GH3 auxin-responsive promoter family protein [Teredinibacter sp. KSP-S5-2]|uniref:GH3 auxin-responsive promoter family protein n=1 Tax=Teredinibacter sp. KSP-S5-2 TaxID=3034506 RepID=UPI002934DB8D|nr:GH3 auxin-responsive promoter family protein [Teredinibacter sp. KSP-S5-2]WNO11152.1 GH3 auxin-responsive promoter family protein [Teredinibacter sp. KSP-S5-2]
MEKNSIIIDKPESSMFDERQSEVVLPEGYSTGYKFRRLISQVLFAAKSGCMYGVILLMELFRAPSALMKGEMRGYISGFFQRYRQATTFVIGGERLFSELMLVSKHPMETQLNLLKQIITENSCAQYGKDHNFSGIKTVEQYRNEVPINSYENLMPYIEAHLQGKADSLIAGSPCYYATTSGSTGKPKFIPVTRQIEKDAHEGSARLWSYSLYKNESKSYSGQIVVIVSPAVEGYTEGGVPFGSISGQYIKNLNENIRSKYAVPYELYEVKDYETRYYCILLLGMAAENVTMLSSTNPSTLSLLGEKGNQHRDELIEDIRYGRLNARWQLEPHIRQLVESRLTPNPERADYLLSCIEKDPDSLLRPKHYWRDLVVVACWTGGNSQVFLDRMHQWYGQVNIKDLGYLASEIRGSVPLDINKSEGVLTVDENFFEFVEEGESTLYNENYKLINQLEVGKRYRLFFTNRGGLYRYDINDIIQVKGFFNGIPKIDFIQKGKGVTSITGEKLYEQQVLDVMNRAAEAVGVKVVYFQMQARVELSRYDLFCEFERPVVNEDITLREFIETVELFMREMNLEYKTKRDSLRLSPMQLHVLGENSFESFRKWRVENGVREAQIKNVPLSSDISLVEPLSVTKIIEIK